MDLQTIVTRYHDAFLARFGQTLNTDQHSALNAMIGCRQGQYGELDIACAACSHHETLPRSCGHRACNQCQYASTQTWLTRQLKKQLPVTYYMATFTLPSELRGVAKAHRKTVYRILMQSAVTTLKTFGLNQKGFQAELGLCAVLHTHTRRLDYHPHVHIVIPGGGVHRARNEWRTLKGNYLFNGNALAKVFRAIFLQSLREVGLAHDRTPTKWVVHCDKVGRGKEALQYLARYLYRGVVSNHNILEDDGQHVTFQFRDSATQQWMQRRMCGEDFLHLILQHVLPKGFRRARDYGFLHGNARALLRIVQWILKVNLEVHEETALTRRRIMCSVCKGVMQVIGIRRVRAKPG